MSFFRKSILDKSAPTAQGTPPIGKEQLKKLTLILQKYKAGKTMLEHRIVSSENWWKLRNSQEEQKVTNIGRDGGFKSVSGWLHNVIVSKHADAMEAFPEPNILPREESDKSEARMLSAIIPCVLEQNKFDSSYSDAMWQKLKTGTGVYKVIWDSNKLGGLGDISVECVNLLNLYWEPGVKDIQKSRYFFHTELCDKDLLIERYPVLLKDGIKGQTFMSTKFQYDDHVDTENKVTIIDVYYHKVINGKKTLQYIKYVNDIVLYATENNPETASAGLYNHAKYPYVFDPLFPVEGSPCGYGFVDICRNPQTEIDLFKTSFVKSAMVGSTPRFLSRGDGSVNEEEFLDLSKPIVHVSGNLSDDYLKQINFSPLSGNYINILDRTIQELRETSGNTETSTGNVSSGVTAASAIAALQEASGKGSRDSTASAYRAYSQIVELCIELIRQFYDMPRQFRILGQPGAEEYISYTNKRLKGQHQGNDLGTDMGYRLPVFDIKISAQKKNIYTKVTQNELALQFFKMGFFNPQMADQAVMCLDLMEFDGKDGVIAKVAQNGIMFKKLIQYMQMCLSFAQVLKPEMVNSIVSDFSSLTGQAPNITGIGGGGAADGYIRGVGKDEPQNVKSSRERAASSSQPN